MLNVVRGTFEDVQRFERTRKSEPARYQKYGWSLGVVGEEVSMLVRVSRVCVCVGEKRQPNAKLAPSLFELDREHSHFRDMGYCTTSVNGTSRMEQSKLRLSIT